MKQQMVYKFNLSKLCTCIVLSAFMLTSINVPGGSVFAQESFSLPAPGVRVHLSPEFNPPIFKGIKVHPDNPFRFDFILDKGDSLPKRMSSPKTEAIKLIKYFLASLTIPENDLWVNLSPYEKDRIIPQSFGLTEMGRDLLAEDYVLKQITASLIYPEDEIGKKFWKRIYEEAKKEFGTTNIPVNTFNKVWIVPEKAVVYENVKAETAYVVESKLKVMLEQDYLALSHNVISESSNVIPAKAGIHNKNDINAFGSQIVREIVIPELTKEVNEDKNFAQLRQIYNSLILATWYKKKIKNSILSQVYTNKNKVAGINIDDPQEKEKIYERYLKAFKKGVFNYIKEEAVPASGMPSKKQGIFPRKYFSGGTTFNDEAMNAALLLTSKQSVLSNISLDSAMIIKVNCNLVGNAITNSVSSFNQFQDWLGNVSPDRLENKIIILDTLETLLRGLRTDLDLAVRKADALNALITGGFVTKEDIREKRVVEILLLGLSTGSSLARKANADALNALITGGLVTKKEIIIKIREKGVVETLLLGLSTGSSLARKADADALNALITGGLVTKKEIIIKIREQGVVETLLRGLSTDSDWDVRVDALNALITGGLVTKEEVIIKIREQGVIETLLLGLSTGSDWDVRVDALNALITGGLVTKEDIKEKGVVETLLRGLSTDLDWDVRVDALNALITGGLVTKEEVIIKIREKGVVETLLRVLSTASDWDVRKADTDTLNALITGGLVTKEDIRENRVVETLLRGLSTDSDWDVRVDALNALITGGLVTKEEVIIKIREKGVVETLLLGLSTDSDWDVRVDALNALITGGLVTKEEVIIKIREKRVVETLLLGLSTALNWDVRKADADALNALITGGLVTKEDIRENRVVETLLLRLSTDPDLYVRNTDADAFNALITGGLVTKEDIKKKGVVETILRGLSTDLGWDVRADALNALITGGLVTKEEVIIKIKEKRVVETLLLGLSTASDSNVRKADADAFNALITGGLVTKEDIKENRVVETLLLGLSTASNWDVRKADADAFNTLITGGLMTKEEGFTKNEIETMFRNVYGRDPPPGDFLHNYLKFIAILRDTPHAAYQISNWNSDEMEELFRIFDFFVRGTTLNASYRKEGRVKNFLEKELIKDYLNLLSSPKILLSRLKEKFKKIINASSVKLAIRVYEIASVNAAKGLIQATGLNKDKVIILYDREIDHEQATRFFPGYVIQGYQGFSEKGVVKVEFHDYGNMKMESSGDTFSASLPYTPFKFNLPIRASEEVNSMKKSLGIIDTKRKVIVIGSPSDAEFSRFIQAYNSLYNNLPYPERPLLIIGFRQRRDENELRLLGSLSGQSIAVRSDATVPLPDVKSNNVLILNTAGELLKMYALANIAVVGNDRNIFEPASQQAAVLYFGGSWTNNREGKDALVDIGAAKIFSKENLERLISNSDKTTEMARNGTKAVATYRSEVQSKTEEFVLQIIGANPELISKFITSSAGSVNPVEQTLDRVPVTTGSVTAGDSAQLSKSDDYGGIDLTPANMNLQIQNAGEGVKFHVDRAMLQKLKNASGFVPVIISIQPMTDLKGFLGINSTVQIAQPA